MLKDAFSFKILWFCDPQPMLLVGLTPKKIGTHLDSGKNPLLKIRKSMAHLCYSTILTASDPEESGSGQVLPALKSKFNHDFHSKMNPKQSDYHQSTNSPN